MMKQLSPSISSALNIVFNGSINQGIFPSAMKKAEVILLYKGKDQDQIVNYRPISLLIMISKVLEKFIYSRVDHFIDQEKILYKNQYGFRGKHSCEQALIELTGELIQASEQKLESVALFLDLSKAFDTLNHEVL